MYAEHASTPVKATAGSAAQPDAFLAQLIRSAAGVGEGPGADVLTAADLEVYQPTTQREIRGDVERSPRSHSKPAKVSWTLHSPSAAIPAVIRALHGSFENALVPSAVPASPCAAGLKPPPRFETGGGCGRQAAKAVAQGGTGAGAEADGVKKGKRAAKEEEEEESEEQQAEREATQAVEAPLLCAYARTTNALAGLLHAMDAVRAKHAVASSSDSLPPDTQRLVAEAAQLRKAADALHARHRTLSVECAHLRASNLKAESRIKELTCTHTPPCLGLSLSALLYFVHNALNAVIALQLTQGSRRFPKRT